MWSNVLHVNCMVFDFSIYEMDSSKFKTYISRTPIGHHLLSRKSCYLQTDLHNQYTWGHHTSEIYGNIIMLDLQLIFTNISFQCHKEKQNERDCTGFIFLARNLIRFFCSFRSSSSQVVRSWLVYFGYFSRQPIRLLKP